MWSELRLATVAALAGGVILFFLPAKSNESNAWTITVTGTIVDDIRNSNGGTLLNGTGIFGTPGTSLIGDTYTETITTDPSLNSHVDSNSTLIESYGGPGIGGCCGAPYRITVTVNGFTYSQTETNTFINYAYLLEGLSNGLGNQDTAFQEVESNGCSTVYGVCTSSYILAFSTQTPFVFKLAFHHPLFSNDLTPDQGGRITGSNTYFLFNNGPDLTTDFYGSIASITVHP
jgi:hypothetical protein